MEPEGTPSDGAVRAWILTILPRSSTARCRQTGGKDHPPPICRGRLSPRRELPGGWGVHPEKVSGTAWPASGPSSPSIAPWPFPFSGRGGPPGDVTPTPPPRTNADRIVERSLDTVGAAELRKRLIPPVSGEKPPGWTMARVLAQETSLVLLTSHTNSPGPPVTSTSAGASRTLAREGCSVVAPSLHNGPETWRRSTATRMMVLSVQGGDRRLGSPSEILTPERIEESSGSSHWSGGIPAGAPGSPLPPRGRTPTPLWNHTPHVQPR